jgi:TRAP-type C4-dicarboxylate transport system substrate-binding protein
MTQRLAVATATALALLPAGGCDSNVDKAGGRVPAETTVLRIVNARSAAELVPYRQELAERSDRQVILEGDDRFHADSLNGELHAIRAVQEGSTDLALVPARAFDQLGTTAFDALLAPLQVDTPELQEQVLSGDIAADMLDELRPLGLTGLGILPGPMRVPSGITRPLVTVEDYRGAVIGISPSTIAERSLRAIGARPVATTFEGADVTGFDGIDLQTTGIAGNEYDGTVRWITTNVNLWPRPLVLVMSTRRFDQLKPVHQEWLRAAAQAAIAPTAAFQSDETDLAPMCRRGRVHTVQASEVQLERLRHAFEPVLDSLRDDPTTAGYLERIAAMRHSTPPAQAPLDCAPVEESTAPEQSPVTALDGQYVLSLSIAELAEADKLDPGDVAIVEENYGEFRLVLDRNRWAYTQRQPPACTWGYGTFSYSKHRINLLTLDGGGHAPHGAVSKAGEIFDYDVSLYEGRMKWTVVPGAVSPPPWAFKPWQRQATQPAPSFLHRDCSPPEQALRR